MSLAYCPIRETLQTAGGSKKENEVRNITGRQLPYQEPGFFFPVRAPFYLWINKQFYILQGRFPASATALGPGDLHRAPWKWAEAGRASWQSHQVREPGWLPLSLPCSFLTSSRRRWRSLPLRCKVLISIALCSLWSTSTWINSLNTVS